jgi:hypothetical protein
VELAFKPWKSVFVTVDGAQYRVPRAHLPGPLLLAVPQTGDTEPTAYAGFGHRRFSVNLSGTVRFEAITLR